jgi:hypothetical protein
MKPRLLAAIFLGPGTLMRLSALCALVVFVPALVVGCDRQSSTGALLHAHDGASTPVLGDVLQGSASLKDVQYVITRQNGVDFLCFSAVFQDDPSEILSRNSIALTSVSGDDVLAFVKKANAALGGGFPASGGMSGSGRIANSDQLLVIAVDPQSRRCLGYICRWGGR